jgi:nicotinamidase-related amidase
MPITTLDPVTALVVIDLQKGIVGMPLAAPIAGVIERSVALARAFRTRQLPVVLVNVAGAPSGRTDRQRTSRGPLPPDWAQLVAELDAQPDDIRVTKYTQGAFHGTPLDMLLRRRGATQVVLTGVATSSGVESTARAAYEHGYNVTFAVDAMTDLGADAHAYAVDHVFPRFGEVGTTADVLGKLAERA